MVFCVVPIWHNCVSKMNYQVHVAAESARALERLLVSQMSLLLWTNPGVFGDGE